MARPLPADLLGASTKRPFFDAGLKQEFKRGSAPCDSGLEPDGSLRAWREWVCIKLNTAEVSQSGFAFRDFRHCSILYRQAFEIDRMWNNMGRCIARLLTECQAPSGAIIAVPG